MRMTPVSALYAGFHDRMPMAVKASCMIGGGDGSETIPAVEVGLSSFPTPEAP